jgi:hypothetical protein
MGSTSDWMVTPVSAHLDSIKTPDPNLLVDIDFDPPSCMAIVGDSRPPRDRTT